MINNRSKATRLATDSAINKGSSEASAILRPITIIAWSFLGLSALATFTGFMFLDPNPDLLLSICAASNVAIILAAIYRLYQWDLLLSPMMLIFIGPTMILYYSLGNLGVRMAGATGFARNPGTLAYYPLVALLSTIGLLLYCWIVFDVFQKAFRQIAIKYQDLYWQPRQALATILIGLAILTYLSLKYSFMSGYFRNVESDIDRWLIATMNSFVLLIVIVNVSVFARAINNRSRLLPLCGIILSVVLALGLRSRTFMLIVLILIVLCWITIKPKFARLSFFLPIGLIGIIVFSLGTSVKYLQGGSNSVLENLFMVSSQESSQIITMTSQGIKTDNQYRTGGFEFPAAILRCLYLGASPSYGEGLVGAALQGLPGFMRPTGSFTERGGIALHYWKYCKFYDDSMAIPLISGLGDWGIPGVLIYLVFGCFSWLLWRVVQSSPRFFVAYLLVPFFPDYPFWEVVFTGIKTMGFIWLVLWIIGPLIMPRWLPDRGDLIRNSYEDPNYLRIRTE
jgi:hypothetical protein